MAGIDWAGMLDRGSRWWHLVTLPEDQIFRLIDERELAAQVVVRVVRGDHCTTKMSLMQEWASALQFPEYFGRNWDALDECLNDLEWLPGAAYLIFITKIEQVLPDDESAFRTLLDVLRHSAEGWAGSADREEDPYRRGLFVPFRVVFHCEEEMLALVRHRLQQAGLE